MNKRAAKRNLAREKCPGDEVRAKRLVCDKRDRAIICMFRRDLYLTALFSGRLQKDLFKGG